MRSTTGRTLTAVQQPPRPEIASQQVAWWEVHEFVQPWLELVGCWPTIGTPEWCLLPSDHPAKIAAVLDAAQHWALRVETCQEARCEASKAISAAAEMLYTPSGIQLSWDAIR